MFLPLLHQTFGLDNLASVELPVFIGFLEHSAQALIIVLGAGNFQGGGERDGAALHAFDQAFLPLVEQEDDVLDVLRRETGFVDDGVGVVVPFAQDFDVGQDFQWPVRTSYQHAVE